MKVAEPEFHSVQSVLDQIVKSLTVVGHTDVDKRNAVLITRETLGLLAEQLLNVCKEEGNPYGNIGALLDPSSSVFVVTRQFEDIKPTINTVLSMFEYLRFEGVLDVVCDQETPENTMAHLLTVLCIILQKLHSIYPYSWVAMKMQILKAGKAFYI